MDLLTSKASDSNSESVSNEELRAQARRSAPQIKIAAGIWIAGMMIIAAITVIWIVLASVAGDYYSNTKAVRDAAEAGSGVLSQLSNIQATKAWLLPLDILGIATFLFGFGFAFASILKNVRLRGATMAAVLPALKERKAGS